MDISDLEQAFKNWHELLYNYAYLRVGDQSIAEDIVQETFYKAWRSRKTYDEDKSSLKNWLFIIATNAINDSYKKNRPSQPLDENLGSTDSITEKTSKKEMSLHIFEQIKKLSDRDQELIILRYKNEFKISEIAEILAMEEGTCKVALHRAMKRLKKLCKL